MNNFLPNIKLKNIKTNKSFIANLWSLSLVLYFYRTVFTPVKYLAILSISILFILSIAFIIKTKKKLIFSIKFIKEFILIGVIIIVNTLSYRDYTVLIIKDLINFFTIYLFVFSFILFKNKIKYERIIKLWLFFSILVGTIAILLYFLPAKTILILKSISQSTGISLVSDYNFYALFFLITIIIVINNWYQNILKEIRIIDFFIIWVSIVNIILSGSRRAIITLLLILFIQSVYLIICRKSKNKYFINNLLYFNKSILISIIISWLIFLFLPFIIKNQKIRKNITLPIYRYSTILSNKINYSDVDNLLWRYSEINWNKYKNDNEQLNIQFEYWNKYKNLKDTNNLLYNGNFKFHDYFWNSHIPSVKHKIIKTKYGNAIRVFRNNEKGYWPLNYVGRDIYYHKNVTYTFKFKYRVIKGSTIPFNVGWSIKENDKYIAYLKKRIKKIDNQWYECVCSYKFKKSHIGRYFTFISTLDLNSIVDFADVKLNYNITDNNKYVDETLYLKKDNKINILLNGNFKYGTKFWGKTLSYEDTNTYQVTKTKYGNTIIVKRRNDKDYWPLRYKGRKIFYHKGYNYKFEFIYRLSNRKIKSFNIGWYILDSTKGLVNLPFISYPVDSTWRIGVASYTFKQDHYNVKATFLNSLENNTIISISNIKLLCDKKLSDSTYMDQNFYKINNLKKEERFQKENKLLEKVISPRTMRWKYALELFNNYPLINKIFGNGFDYLYLFAEKFPDPSNPTKKTDYPHNPILSALLYSGIIGALYYVYFLILVFWYYWKYRKYHMLFFVLYLISFFFSFVSGNSHFSVPIFAMLSVVPFITRYLVKNKKIEQMLIKETKN